MKKPVKQTSNRSPRKTASRTASNAKDFFQAILNASPLTVLVFEAEGKTAGKIIAANSAASKRLGYSVAQLCRMNVADLDAPASMVSSTDLIARVRKERTVTIAIQRCHKDGHDALMEVQATLLKWQRKNLIVSFEREMIENHPTDARLRLYEMELSKLEEIDPLTERFNRQRFIQLAEMEFQRFKRYNHSFAFILADIDHFRSINERFGNEIGDVVIKFLALQLASQMRKNDLVGRLGAEEFGVLMPETDGVEALKIGERVRAACNQMTVQTSKGDVKLTISLGVTQVTNLDSTFESVLNRAELAMRQAKEKGRDRVESA